MPVLVLGGRIEQRREGSLSRNGSLQLNVKLVLTDILGSRLGGKVLVFKGRIVERMIQLRREKERGFEVSGYGVMLGSKVDMARCCCEAPVIWKSLAVCEAARHQLINGRICIQGIGCDTSDWHEESLN